MMPATQACLRYGNFGTSTMQSLLVKTKESGWSLVEQTCFSHLPDVQVWPPAQRPTSLGYCRVDTSTCHGPG